MTPPVSFFASHFLRASRCVAPPSFPFLYWLCSPFVGLFRLCSRASLPVRQSAKAGVRTHVHRQTPPRCMSAGGCVCVCVCKARQGEALSHRLHTLRRGHPPSLLSAPPCTPCFLCFLSFCSVLTLLTFPPCVMGLGPDARRHVNKAFSTSSIFATNTSEQACPFCV